MGSWWHIKVGNTEIPVFGKNYVADEIMLAFTEDDRFVDQAKKDTHDAFLHQIEADPDLPITHEPAPWHDDMIGYATNVQTLRARLDLQGFSTQWVRELAAALIHDEYFSEDNDETVEYRRKAPTRFTDAAAVVAALTTRKNMSHANGPAFSDNDPEHVFLGEQWDRLRESFDDPRFALALALSGARSDTIVTLDLTDLVTSGYLDMDDNPHLDARERMAASVAAGGPVIVITEGSSDTRWLRAALDVAAPHVAHIFTFLDFAEVRAPGGTDRVVSLTKGMAGANVMNRIVAVLDNDTAGRLAAQQLTQLNLPTRIRVVSLPSVPHASDYPTLGTEGRAQADINGRAASVEFMFGEDVLRDTDGTLFPVRWTGWVPSANDYQGSLERHHKTTVGNRLDHHLGPEQRSRLPQQIGEGCELLAAMLISAAAPQPHVPASDVSDLTAQWRQELLPSN